MPMRERKRVLGRGRNLLSTHRTAFIASCVISRYRLRISTGQFLKAEVDLGIPSHKVLVDAE